MQRAMPLADLLWKGLIFEDLLLELKKIRCSPSVQGRVPYLSSYV